MKKAFISILFLFSLIQTTRAQIEGLPVSAFTGVLVEDNTAPQYRITGNYLSFQSYPADSLQTGDVYLMEYAINTPREILALDVDSVQIISGLNCRLWLTPRDGAPITFSTSTGVITKPSNLDLFMSDANAPRGITTAAINRNFLKIDSVLNSAGINTNFAQDNLTFTGNRVHNLDNNTLRLTNVPPAAGFRVNDLEIPAYDPPFDTMVGYWLKNGNFGGWGFVDSLGRLVVTDGNGIFDAGNDEDTVAITKAVLSDDFQLELKDSFFSIGGDPVEYAFPGAPPGIPPFKYYKGLTLNNPNPLAPVANHYTLGVPLDTATFKSYPLPPGFIDGLSINDPLYFGGHLLTSVRSDAIPSYARLVIAGSAEDAILQVYDAQDDVQANVTVRQQGRIRIGADTEIRLGTPYFRIESPIVELGTNAPGLQTYYQLRPNRPLLDSMVQVTNADGTTSWQPYGGGGGGGQSGPPVFYDSLETGSIFITAFDSLKIDSVSYYQMTTKGDGFPLYSQQIDADEKYINIAAGENTAIENRRRSRGR
jgi:hypothetical protein